MRFPLLALAFVLAASTPFTHAQTDPGLLPLTLSEALRLAESHPSVRARQAQMAAAEGRSREAASLLFKNPELGLDRTRRRGATPDGRANEWGVGIAQSIETGGQQARRREAASASLAALRAEIDDARRLARADAALRFNAVLAAQRRVLIEQRSVALFDGTSQAIAKRRAAGEDTRLDANVALIEVERARNALAVSRERLRDARVELASALSLPPSSVPGVVGDLAMPQDGGLPYGPDQLLASAQALPKLRALSAQEQAARARVGVEQGNRNPDVTIGLRVGRDGPASGRESVTTLSLSVPLPLFQRNDAAIGQALSDVQQAEIERTSTTRDVLAQIRQLWFRLDSQRQRLQRLRQAMVAAALDNQQLAEKSRQAGQIGLLDQLLVNRQALDAERDLNEALAEFHMTRIELENAAGWSQEGFTQ
ncbi:MAG: TolC family protein [Rhodoferax sp.]|nr:TolC family protein [Rhodoferax sp.]